MRYKQCPIFDELEKRKEKDSSTHRNDNESWANVVRRGERGEKEVVLKKRKMQNVEAREKERQMRERVERERVEREKNVVSLMPEKIRQKLSICLFLVVKTTSPHQPGRYVTFSPSPERRDGMKTTSPEWSQ